VAVLRVRVVVVVSHPHAQFIPVVAVGLIVAVLGHGGDVTGLVHVKSKELQ
jgi:hypothetical protein